MVERVRPRKPLLRPKTNWATAAQMVPNARRSAGPRVDAFAVPTNLHPPSVTRGVTLAQDTAGAIVGSTAWASAVMQQSLSEGLTFLGYPYLAELAQRPEYRVISQTIADEMTRKWGKFEASGEAEQKTPKKDQPETQPDPMGLEDPEEQAEVEQEKQEEAAAAEKAEAKNERIKQLEDKFKELDVREHCRSIVENDGFFGRAHLYLDTGDTDNRDELKLSIGSGKDEMSKTKVSPQKPLQRIACVEPVWCYPTNYNAIDPLKPTWYKPESWICMTKEIHTSRLLVMVGNEVPDLLKPAYSFGGLSMSQMAQPYVNNWLQTRQSVNDLIQAFVVWGLKTNLAESLGLNGEQLFARLELFNRLRNNRGIMAIDKETEEFFNVTATLSGLEALQAQSQEHMAAVSRIPLVKLLGIQPTGLNASSEGEIRVFYDTIHGRQERLLSPIVETLMHFCMLSLWGEIDEDITWSWNPLWALDEKQEAEVEEVRARTAQIWIDTGVVDKMEERRRVANSPTTPYPGLDPNYEPDLAAEESEGLVPKGAGGGLKAIMGEEGEEGGPDHPEEVEGELPPRGQEEDSVEPSLADQGPTRMDKLNTLLRPPRRRLEAAE